MGNAHPGPQKTQIVINLRHRTNGGAGILGSGLLVNGNGGRQTVDTVHIRLIHLAQKLPGIGRKALHIPALAFCINGIEGETGFSGAGKAGKHHQLVSWDGQIHIFQIVFSCTLDPYLVVHKILLLKKFFIG